MKWRLSILNPSHLIRVWSRSRSGRCTNHVRGTRSWTGSFGAADRAASAWGQPSSLGRCPEGSMSSLCAGARRNSSRRFNANFGTFLMSKSSGTGAAVSAGPSVSMSREPSVDSVIDEHDHRACGTSRGTCSCDPSRDSSSQALGSAVGPAPRLDGLAGRVSGGRRTAPRARAPELSDRTLSPARLADRPTSGKDRQLGDDPLAPHEAQAAVGEAVSTCGAINGLRGKAPGGRFTAEDRSAVLPDQL
jgi:hypothetical protein